MTEQAVPQISLVRNEHIRMVPAASGWDKLKEDFERLKSTPDSEPHYAEKYHALIREAYTIGCAATEGAKPSPVLVELIVADKISKHPNLHIVDIGDLKTTVERELAALLPGTFKPPIPHGYVVLYVADDVPSNTRPFRDALAEVNGKTKQPKDSALFYAFSALVDGRDYLSTGFTTLLGTYSAKNRYAPMVDYVGQLQIQQWGRVHHSLISAFLGATMKGSDWRLMWRSKFACLLDALVANSSFECVPTKTMTNISPFAVAFQAKAGATLNDHLSLYRLQYRGHIYRITEQNLLDSIGAIVDPSKKQPLRTSAAAPPETAADRSFVESLVKRAPVVNRRTKKS